LPEFTLEGTFHKALRNVQNKMNKDGFSFEIVPPEQVPGILPEIRIISDAWIEEKNTREKGFSLGFFDEKYLKQFSIAVVKQNHKIYGFANMMFGANKEELSIDLMRYTKEVPHGIMDYLFINLMFWGKNEGYQWFNLGMAPLSGLENKALAPLWNRIGSFIFQYGEYFYNFQGLRKYKEKFSPVWSPKYLASLGGIIIPRMLTNITTLVSRGLKGVISR
jgi:phosphatidylglycerol lysyltransferase